MTEIAAKLARPIRRLSRPGTAALVLGLVVLLAGAALFARAYTLRAAVLPGVSVAGVDVGGLSRAEAEARLRDELGSRLGAPVRVSVGGESFRVRPDRLWGDRCRWTIDAERASGWIADAQGLRRAGRVRTGRGAAGIVARGPHPQ